MTNIFLYGTLCDKELLEICLGRSLANVSLLCAKLENHSVFWVKNRNFPVIKFSRGSFAQGLAILNIENQDLEQLDFYEGGFDYELRKVSIILKNNGLSSKNSTMEAYVYFNNDANIEVDKNWDLGEWQHCHGLISRLVAKEYMKLQSNYNDFDLLSEYQEIYHRISKNL